MADEEEGQLLLFDVKPYVVRVPWEGRRPRDLTRLALGLILKPQGEKKRERFGLTVQYDLFVPSEKRRTIYDGAPSLLPLREV